MDFSKSVDLYCERLHAGIWAEPANVLSNLSFIIAGVLVLRSISPRPKGTEISAQIAAYLAIAVGLGSSAFHLWAVKWAEILDVFFILLFIIWAIVLYCRQKLMWSMQSIVFYFCLLGALSYIFIILLKDLPLNGSHGYMGVLICLSYLAFRDRQISSKPYLFYGGIVFPISLLFRTIDHIICPFFPMGSHWLWHLLNGLLLYFASMSLVKEDKS